MGSHVSKKRRKTSLSDAEARSKLQKKICLADETPEPIYDIAGCLLRSVPAGTYAKCKVMRKEQLLLQDNLLTSLEGGGQLADLHLIQVLRLEFNCLSHIPGAIGDLSNLQVLDLSNNALKSLPDSLSRLRRLRQLLCRGNGLHAVPEDLGTLPRLATLDLRNNQLRALPPLQNISSLAELRLEDNAPLSHPPPEVVTEGSDAVIAYLCKEAGVEHTGPSEEQDDAVLVDRTPRLSHTDILDGLEENIQRYDQLKENKRIEMLQLEKSLSAAKSQEGEEMMKQEAFKRQLLDELSEGQARLDADVARMAEQRDQDRRRLLTALARLEGDTDRCAAQVAEATARMRDPEAVLARLKLDRLELEQLMVVRQEECDALRRNEVMASMANLVRDSCALDASLQRYRLDREAALRQALTEDQQADGLLRQLLQLKGEEQEARIQQLLSDEAFQRQAFYSLYLEQDASRLQILHQIGDAEEALMQLTMLESTQREAAKESEMARLSEKRRRLADLLLQLRDQQEARERELRRRLQEMDEQRRGQVQHYWMVQYQRLLDSKPVRVRELEEGLAPQLRGLLERAGAEQFLTLFATANVTYKTVLYMNDSDLIELGVHDLSTRVAILRQAALEKEEADLAEKKLPEDEPPSAPPSAEPPVEGAAAAGEGATGVIDETATFRSTHTELECVVCLDRKTEVVFLNCGHLCACRDCAGPLQNCPMCRQAILQKLVITSAIERARS